MTINETCECIPCPECNGSGYIWVSGDRSGPERFDDDGDFESCPLCGGDGLYFYCLKCQLEEDMEEDDGV